MGPMALDPTRLIGPFHESSEDEVGGARWTPGQYRETISYQFFHSLNGQHAGWKRPASRAFSPMNTAAVPRFSTDVEESGEGREIPGNASLFASSDRS